MIMMMMIRYKREMKKSL